MYERSRGHGIVGASFVARRSLKFACDWLESLCDRQQARIVPALPHELHADWEAIAVVRVGAARPLGDRCN